MKRALVFAPNHLVFREYIAERGIPRENAVWVTEPSRVMGYRPSEVEVMVAGDADTWHEADEYLASHVSAAMTNAILVAARHGLMVKTEHPWFQLEFA